MISPEEALALVAHLSDSELRASVSEAFLHNRFIPTALRGDDQPKDLYISLLSTPREIPVLNGCIDVLTVLASNLFAPVPALTDEKTNANYHLMRLIGVARPTALQGHVQGL